MRRNISHGHGNVELSIMYVDVDNNAEGDVMIGSVMMAQQLSAQQ